MPCIKVVVKVVKLKIILIRLKEYLKKTENETNTVSAKINHPLLTKKKPETQRYAASLNLGPLTSHLLGKTKIKNYATLQTYKPTLVVQASRSPKVRDSSALSVMLVSKPQGARKYATPWTLNPLLFSSPEELESTQLFPPPPHVVV